MFILTCGSCPIRYQHSAAHSGFWDLLASSGLTLVSSHEVASANVSPEEASAFIAPPQVDGDLAQASRAVLGGADLEELDDME